MNKIKETDSARRRSSGFTLVELMVVIAIIGVLASIAVPQYNTYSKRARFSEIVLATGAYKSSMEIAVQTGRATAVSALDAERFGIPSNKSAGTSTGQYVESVTALNGLVTGVGTDSVDDAVYQIQATIPAGTNGIRWVALETHANACQKLGLC